jgi:DNA-binding MarR family transcriptional regulator
VSPPRDPAGTEAARLKAQLEVDSLIDGWGGERPDVDMRSLRVFIPLRRALQRAEARRAVVLAQYGLTPAMLDLLVLLRGWGDEHVWTPSDLAQRLVVSAARISQRLDQLEQSGLVERTANTDDRRKVSVRLTRAGRSALDDLIGVYMEHEEALLHGLSTRDRALLADLLVRLNASISTAE